MQNIDVSPNIRGAIPAQTTQPWQLLAKHLATGRSSEAGVSKLSLSQSQALYAMRGMAISVVVIVHLTVLPLRAMFFVMPLFFFLSGYLFRPAPDFRAYLASITRKLIVPYALFLAIISIPGVASLFAQEGTEAGFNKIAQLLLGGEMIKGMYAAYWYAPCFFFMHIAYSLCARWLTGWQLTLLCVPISMLAYWNSANDGFWLPLAINVAAMSFPIMHLGWLYRQREFSPQADRIFHNIMLMIGLTYTVLAASYIVPGLQMKLARYGWPIVTVLSAVCMVIMTKRAFEYLTKFRAVNLIMGNLGKASLIVMFAHMPLEALFVEIFDIYNPVIRVCFALIASYGLFRLLEECGWGRALFLGKPYKG